MQDIIDVVEEFRCPYQTERYQAAYREWRRKKSNRYAFRFTRNTKESAFSENQAIVNQTPAQAEQSVLRRFGSLIGWALIVFLLLENLFDKVIVLLLEKAGIRIEFVYRGNSHFFGDEQIVFVFTALMNLLKYLVPALILGGALKIPARVATPLRIIYPQKIFSGTALVMFLSVGMGMFCVPKSAELEKYRVISDTTGVDEEKMVYYVLFMVLIVPVVAELLLHGCMFQALRQFGDAFAIGTVTLLSALMTHNLQDGIRIGMITLTISYFVIRSGSFITAVFLRIVHEIYMFTLSYIEIMGSVYSVQWWLIVLLPCVVGTATGIYLLLTHKLRQDKIQYSYTYLNTWDQATAFYTAMPMVIYIISCVLLFVITIMLE